MDTIALVEDDQKKVVKRVKDIKEGIKVKNQSFNLAFNYDKQLNI